MRGDTGPAMAALQALAEDSDAVLKGSGSEFVELVVERDGLVVSLGFRPGVLEWHLVATDPSGRRTYTWADHFGHPDDVLALETAEALTEIGEHLLSRPLKISDPHPHRAVKPTLLWRVGDQWEHADWGSEGYVWDPEEEIKGARLVVAVLTTVGVVVVAAVAAFVVIVF